MTTEHDGSADRTAPRGRAMRCAEVTRELAAPTGGRDRADVAGHLASCPTCASWAERSAQLDGLWDATRPPEPSVAWETLWARVTQDAESAQEERPAPA